MKIHCKYDKLVPITELKPHNKNANKHPEEQIKRLAKILAYQGFRYPIKVSNQTGMITSGHGRVEAAKLNGWLEVPVNFQDYESMDQEIADLHADNAIASWAEFDLDFLSQQLPEINIDLELLGLKDLPQIEFVSEVDEDSVPETKEEPISKLGDLYQLGEHRLLCGDSTNIQHVERLMNGEKADMVFTDPPYGMKLDTDYSSMKGWHQGKKYKPVEGDNEDFKPELIQIMLGIFSYCKEIILWGADYYAELLPEKNKGSWAVWDKRVEESKDTMYGSCFELCWSKNKHKRLIFRKMWAGFMGDAEASKRLHPTQKPTELIKMIFNEWAKDLTTIVDLFGGSGSTLIACEKTNRKCFMMELDPQYIDVIIKRFIKYSGKPVYRLINGDKIDVTKDFNYYEKAKS